MTAKKRSCCGVLLALALLPRCARATESARLEYLDLGPLRLEELVPGRISILPQVRIINGIRHHRFIIHADGGRFEYRSADGAVAVLSGRIHALHIEGYVQFANPDQIGSMIVEGRDDLTFILDVDDYSLPKYGDGTVALVQRRVWVGNQDRIDLLAQTGSIYFRTGAVTWRGFRLQTNEPPLVLTADARNRDPARGVLFVFDLGKASLRLEEGAFETTAVTAPAPALLAQGSALAVGPLGGAIQIDALPAGLRLNASRLTVGVASAALGPDAVPIAAVGALEISGLTAEAAWSDAGIVTQQLAAARVHFVPHNELASNGDVAPGGRLANVLALLGIGDRGQARQQALALVSQRLAAAPADNLAFLSIRRTIIEKAISLAVDKASKALSGVQVGFGRQSAGLAAELAVPLPGVDTPVKLPVSYELTPAVRGRGLILQPAAQILLLGDLSIRRLANAGDFLHSLCERLHGVLANNEAGLAAFELPVSFTPDIDVDLASLSTADLRITAQKYDLPLKIDPIVLIDSDAMWILAEVAIQ